MEIQSVENRFNHEEVWVEGEPVEFTEQTASIFKKFTEDFEGETDEDLSYLVTKNQEEYPLISMITRTRRAY